MNILIIKYPLVKKYCCFRTPLCFQMHHFCFIFYPVCFKSQPQIPVSELHLYRWLMALLDVLHMLSVNTNCEKDEYRHVRTSASTKNKFQPTKVKLNVFSSTYERPLLKRKLLQPQCLVSGGQTSYSMRK